MMGMSPTRHDEVERKDDVDLTMVLPNQAEAEGVVSVRPPEQFRLDAVISTRRAWIWHAGE